MFFGDDNSNNDSNNNNNGHRSSSNKHFEDFYDQSQLSPRVRRHLSAVYSHLAITALLTLLACWMQINGIIGGGGLVPAIGGVAALWSIRSVRMQALRQIMLYAFGFLEGMSLAPIVGTLYYIQPQLILSSLLSTFLIFAGFTATALYAPRRSYLYLGGLISTGMMVLLAASLLNVFFVSSNILDNAVLYIGLLVFAFLITFDTQLIVERVESGRTNADAVHDAANMLINIVAILRRLMIIMASDQRRSKTNKRRRDDSDNRYPRQRFY